MRKTNSGKKENITVKKQRSDNQAGQELLRLKDELAQRAADKYHALFNSIDEGFAILEMVYEESGKPIDFRLLEVNNAFARNTGITGAAGKTAYEIVAHVEQYWVDNFEHVASTGQAMRFENYAAAIERWLDIYVSKLGTADSRQVAVIFKDITERKWREINTAFLLSIQDDFARLTSSSDIMEAVGKKLGKTMNLSMCAFVDIYEDGDKAVIEYCWHREGAFDLRGVYKISEFVSEQFSIDARNGKTVVVNDAGNDSRTDPEAFARLQIGAFIGAPFTQTGKWKFFLAVYDSQPRNWRKDEIELFETLATIIFLRLVRARAEEALQESEKELRQTQLRLESALQAGLAGTFYWDIQPDLIITDENMRQYFSLPVKALTEGVPLSEVLPAIYNEDRPLVVNALTGALQQTGKYAVEYRVNHPDGLRWLSARGLAERNDEGTIIGLPGFVVDITRIKEAEEVLLKAEEKYRVKLEQEVNERTAALKESEEKIRDLNRELESRNTELNTFSSIAANDYNETLRQLYTSLEYIASNDARHLSNTGRANIRRAQSSIQKMKLLTEDILSYTKLHELDTEAAAVDLYKVIQNILAGFEKKTDLSVISIECNDMPVITGYPFLLSLLFHHLLDNAIKFRKKEGQSIIINYLQANSGEVVAEETIPAGITYHVISVADKGIGFPRQEVKKIFDIFYRLSDKTLHKGSGIGLAVCKKIMDIHGGFIKAESEPGIGSTFFCFFPVKGNHSSKDK